MAIGDEDIAICVAANNKAATADARAAVVDLFRRAPEYAWTFGTLSKLAREHEVRTLEGPALAEAAMLANLSNLEQELGLHTATGAERLLIENVLSTWWSLQVATHYDSKVVEAEMTLDLAKFWNDRLDRAQSRFDRAIRSLTQFRQVRMSVQVNIAEKQINVNG